MFAPADRPFGRPLERPAPERVLEERPPLPRRANPFADEAPPLGRVRLLDAEEDRRPVARVRGAAQV